MALRCGCPNDGDETVFGPAHECVEAPAPMPQWRWFHRSGDPEPRPYEQVLSPDELED